MKTVILVRHAKSSWKDSSLKDYDRPLNKRGKRDAPFMGKKIREREILPDLILSSPAKRARKTAIRVAEEIGYPKEKIQYDDKMYHSVTTEPTRTPTGESKRRRETFREVPPEDKPPDPPQLDSAWLAARRKSWARLIRRVYEVDPLLCPCGQRMRVVGFIA